MALGSERSSVQNPMIRYATDIGWQYIEPNEAIRLRAGETGLVFKELFINQMVKLNSEFMDNILAEELVKSIGRIQSNIEGNLIAWEYIKGIRTVFVPNEKRERNVSLIDTDCIYRNTFHVTDEFRFTNGNKTIRPDIVFLVNGLPVLFIETKAAHKTEGIPEALDQVRRYHSECPELLTILQLYSITHLIHYYYGGTWSVSKKCLYNWKEEATGNYESLVKAFLDRKRIVRLLTDFILFTRKDDELRKVVLRPHQMRAVDSLVNRAMDREKRRGLVWHTQGSGKTYTMIVTAKKIIENPVFQNPTIIMLVDRNELETQLFGNLVAIGIEHVAVANSKRHLIELLEADTRGLIVSMIHKFDDIPENINTRDNIIVLVDEAHRTTGGVLGNYLMGALPNATYLGFTGTPIDKTSYGQSTFTIFGKDDPPYGYTDKYGIVESIEDGTTVPLHYALAPNDLLVDRETLDKEFLSLAEAEGVSDVEELNKVLEKAVNLRNMLKNRDRVKLVAKYVADHYREYIEPMGYKAFLVGVDREACALYKDELDKHLPPEYSNVVYSTSHDDHNSLLSRYYLSDDEEKRVRKDFVSPDKLPKILIVTEKLLTGFDAPVLYCMYLDKPMRDHILLQAIARVNRPYEDSNGKPKPCGFILDFVGIFSNLEKALAFDSHDIEGVVRDISMLKDRFVHLINQARTNYLTLVEGVGEDRAVESVLNYFIDKDIRDTFYKFFREISEIYDILSPDAFLVQYIYDMETLTRMYRLVREAYERGIIVDREFSRKTAQLVQKYTSTSNIKSSIDVYDIDGDTIRKIEESCASTTEKVFNLLKSISLAVENADKELYLISIGEKAEHIAELFKDRQITTLQALEELKKIIDEINRARQERTANDVPDEVFAIYWVMKHEDITDAESKANYMGGILSRYPHWKHSENHERGVKQELFKVLVQSGIMDTNRINSLAQSIMRVIRGVVR